MKVQGKEIITMVFDMLNEQDYQQSALRIAKAIIHNAEYIVLGIGDIDWEIEKCLKMFHCDDFIKSIPSSSFCTRFYINKEYNINEEDYYTMKKLIYED